MTAYSDARTAILAALVDTRSTYIKASEIGALTAALTDALGSTLAAGVVVLKGSWDASSGSFPGGGTAMIGHFYRVSTGGTVNGQAFTAGDGIQAIVDNASTSLYTSNWQKIEGLITLAEVQAAVGFTFGALASQNTLTSGQVAAAPFGALAAQNSLTAAQTAALPVGPFTAIASAATTDLATVATVGASITGTTTITSLGSGASLLRIVKFAGILTLTHNATSLILPGAGNIATAAGDRAVFLSDASGNWTCVAYTKASGQAVVVVSQITTDFELPTNLSLVASVSGNALTIAVKDSAGADPSGSTTIPFRSATATSGARVLRTLSAAASITIASASTLGTANATPFRLWLVAIDNGGTVELAIINCVAATGVVPLNESALTSTTAIAGAATAGVLYATAARTSKPMRILGYVDYSSGLATAGTWSAAPDIVQLFGPGVRRPGDVVQTARTLLGSSGQGSTIVPFDDTIPQSTEGDQYATLAITPASVVNRLQHDHSLHVTHSAAVTWMTLALFQDSTASALAAGVLLSTTTTGGGAVAVRHEMAAGTISSTTFKLRAGGHQAGTMTLNGNSGARQLGGVLMSGMEITEIMA